MDDASTKTTRSWRRAALSWLGGGAVVVALVDVLVPRPAPIPSPVATVMTPPPPVVEAPPPPPAPIVEEASVPPLETPEEPAWRRFAAAAPAADGRPRVAVVIDDLGLDRARTERAVALAPAVTLSFMTYANQARGVATEARERGHEILVHVPMEPIDRRQDMGPNGLAAGLGPDEVLRRLRWGLDRVDGYVGINNHMGSRFTADAEAMTPVIAELKARGLLFLDSRTIASSQGATLARRAGVPFAERDVFLDDDPAPTAIAARLKELETWARRHATGVAIGHPRDETMAALEAWTASLPGKGIVLVPLSAVVEARDGILLHAEAACAPPAHCHAGP